MGHVLESLGDALDPALELDEEGTSAHGGQEVDGVLASGDAISVFLVEFSPGGVLHVTLGLAGVDPADNIFELVRGVLKLLFSIGEELRGLVSGLLRDFLTALVDLNFALILWDESTAGGDSLGVGLIAGVLSIMKLDYEAFDHGHDLVKRSLRGHHQGDLSKDGLSKWMAVDLSEDLHVLGLGECYLG